MKPEKLVHGHLPNISMAHAHSLPCITHKVLWWVTKWCSTLQMQMSGQVTGKDLSSFADQMMSVANQITDRSTLSRLDTLASTTRQLVINHIQPLEQHKVLKLQLHYTIKTYLGVKRCTKEATPTHLICLQGMVLRQGITSLIQW
jgi:hypothetical protein